MPVKPEKPRSPRLSRQDLRTISQAINRDFAPRFFRPRAQELRQTQFSAQELREVSRQISREYSHSTDHHDPQLVLLPVSPDHLYAYWQTDKQPPFTADQASAVQPKTLTLRVYPEPLALENNNFSPPPATFDIAVSTEQQHSDIILPSIAGDTHQAIRYHATLGRTDDADHFQPWLHSNIAEATSAPRPQAQQLSTAAMLQSIMATSHSGSPTDKTSSGQGK